LVLPIPAFLGIKPVRPHAERPAGDKDHAGRLTVFTSGAMTSLQVHVNAPPPGTVLDSEIFFALAPMLAGVQVQSHDAPAASLQG
jgi:hypothetical protein